MGERRSVSRRERNPWTARFRHHRSAVGPECPDGDRQLRRTWNLHPITNDRLCAEIDMSPPVFLIPSTRHYSGESELHHA